MSRKPKSLWNETTNKELARVVRNFNAKIRRLEKKDPKNKNVLPEKITVAQMKEIIKTKQDLKREINSLQRFSKRGAETIVKAPGNEYNLKITKWQKTEMNRRIGWINRRRKQRLDELEVIEQKSRGQSLGYTLGDIGMGRTDKVSLKPMNAFTSKMSRTDLNIKFKNILRESSVEYWNKHDEILRQNYITAIENNFGGERLKGVVEKIQSMDIKEFKKIFYEEDKNMEIPYHPNDTEKYATLLESIWTPNKKK